MSSFEQAHPSSLRDKLRREWMMAEQPKKVHIFVVVTYTNRFSQGDGGLKNVQNREPTKYQKQTKNIPGFILVWSFDIDF